MGSSKFKLFIFLLISILFISMFATSCSSKANEETYLGFAESFVKLYKDASRSMNVDIQSNMMGYKDASLKLNKLEQVGSLAMAWIDLMKKTAERELWSPVIAEVIEDLGKFKNDRYEIVKLQFVVERTSTRQYSSVIRVFEVYTNKQFSYDEILADLKKTADDFDNTLNAQLAAYKLSNTTTPKVIEQYRTWKVAKLNSSAYKVSGPALGWSGTTLAPGIWTYNVSNQSVTPGDAGSTALEKVIKGK